VDHENFVLFRCTHKGCSFSNRKDSRTNHVNNKHRQLKRWGCTGCPLLCAKSYDMTHHCQRKSDGLHVHFRLAAASELPKRPWQRRRRRRKSSPR
jgi:hypothetical protein